MENFQRCIAQMDKDYKIMRNRAFSHKNIVQFENNYMVHAKEYKIREQKENLM